MEFSKSSEPAFPCYLGDSQFQPGMDKREYFAALAMQALIPTLLPIEGYGKEKIAMAAIAYADELLKQLGE